MSAIRCRGVTLIELVVTIVVISIGVTGILLVLDRNTRESGRPVVEHQAVAVAEAYLEEILAKAFCDPDTATCSPGPGNAPGTASCQVCTPTPPAEASRASYDNVCDYNGLSDTGARSQDDVPIPGLEAYTVQVQVDSGAALNGLSGADCEVLGVTVNVSGPFGVAVALSGFRTNY